MNKRGHMSGFGTPKPVTELNSSRLEYPQWLSVDGCRLYLESDRPGGAGDLDVYVASRGR
jgi:hypothetical protein